MRQIADLDLETAKTLADYSWVEDDITREEKTTLLTIREIAKKDVEAAMLTAEQFWVADGVSSPERRAVSSINGIAGYDVELARRIFDEPFMGAPFRERDVAALSGLHGLLAASPAHSVWSQVSSKSWFTDGLNDNEATLLQVIGWGARIDNDFRLALLETHYFATSTVQLSRGGATEVTVIRNSAFPSDDDTLTQVRTALRGVETYMRQPFQFKDIVVLVSDPNIWPGAGNLLGGPNGLHIRVKDPAYFPDPARFRHAVYHEITHLHLTFVASGPRWLKEGGANFMATFIEADRGGESMADRLESLNSSESDCLSQTIKQHLGNWTRLCDYDIGERFLLTMHTILGEEGLSAAFRELLTVEHGALTETVIHDTLLKHTPTAKEQEFRDAYERLHGPD